MPEEYSLIIIAISIGVIVCSFCFYMQKLQNKRNKNKPIHSFLKSQITYSQYTDSLHPNKLHFTIAGIHYRDCEEKRIARNLCHGDILFLEEEPDNPYHSDAIQVISNEEYTHIGYVPREYCLDVKEIMRQNPDYDVEVTDVRIERSSPFIDAVIKY